MPLRQDVRTGKWFYRFKRNGRDYCEFGFRTWEQARDAEVKALNNAINTKLNPEEVGREMTFKEAVKWWLETYAEPKKASRVNDRSRFGLMAEYWGDAPLKAITTQDVEDFLAKLHKLRGEPISDHTRNHYLAMLKALYNRLKKKKVYMGDNPAWYVEPKKVAKAKVRFLYPAEERQLSPLVSQQPDVFAYYVTGLHTGMRINELRTMRVQDVDTYLRRIHIPNGKGNKSRHVPMSDELVTFLVSFLSGKKPEDKVLPNWSYQYILRHFAAICAVVGIKDVTPHIWRHTFAARLLTRGVPIYKVSKIMGHSSIRVTEEHYGHLCVGDLEDAISQIGGVVTFGGCSNVAAENSKKQAAVAQNDSK
jgi:integrase